MRYLVRTLPLSLALACSSGSGPSTDTDSPDGGSDTDVAGGGGGGGGGGQADFTVTGRAPGAGSLRMRHAVDGPRTVSHVMAVDPSGGAAERVLAPVGADGTFTLALRAGRPYVLVFVDDSAVGVDMVVGVFHAETLDTIATLEPGSALDLGDVTVDAGAASTPLAYDTLLADLGLDPALALTLGAVDDLSLRYANPDIDADGEIDLLQGHPFGLDFHVRATLRVGPGGAALRVSDLLDAFPAADGATVATPDFGLTSIYALYPSTFDATSYVDMSAMPPVLTAGATFTATQADGSTPSSPTSFSGLGFGDTRGWGADYDLARGVELPGSSGSPATLLFGLGATSTSLTFSNVVTRTRASFTDQGTLMPFVRLDTTDGVITGFSWVWKQRLNADTWVDASAETIALLVSDSGAFVGFHLLPAWDHEVGAPLGQAPTGSLLLTDPRVHLSNVSAPDLTTLTASQVCGMAVSYDDKLGLRVFAGGADPDPGVSCW